jgi:hypothetical protein
VWCLELLNRRLFETAARAGVHDSECTDLEAILAALPPVSRFNAEGYLKNLMATTADPTERLCDGKPGTAASGRVLSKERTDASTGGKPPGGAAIRR